MRLDDRLTRWLLGRERLRRRLEARYIRDLQRFLKERQRFAFPASNEPVVSIIIPVFNGAHHTLRCLRSLLTDRSVAFEVIVGDDGSADCTQELLQRFENVTVMRNEANLGFIGTVNKASLLARGRYLLLMNNDAALVSGKIGNAVDVFERRPDAGAVGVRIRFATGRLQEAGAMIFSDGKTDGYLWDGDPDDVRARFQRDVDYCSGAFLFLRTQQFLELGGFDPIYAPAYYEESDYCMKLRRQGYASIYTPAITVEHFEFGSQRTETARAAIERNRAIFTDRWQEFLETGAFAPQDVDRDLYARRLGTTGDLD
jgi:GT2 family glycosyltransferase